MKNKIKRNMLLFFVILFVIIIAAYLKYFYVYPHFTKENISSLAVERMFDNCKKIGSATPEHHVHRGDCYKTVVERFADLSMCKKITVWESRKDCYDYFGKKTNNSALCKTKNCFKYLADINNDPSLCGGDNICVAVAKGDISLCDKLDRLYSKSRCYQMLGVKLGNLQFCKKALGIERTRYEELYKGYAKVNKEEYRGLDSVTENAIKISEQYCLKNAIVRKRNVSLCESVKELYIRDKCYNEIAIELGDISICDKIENIGQRVGCELTFAEKEGDLSVCKKLEKTTSKENWERKHMLARCYEDIIVETGNPSLCEKIGEVNDKTIEGQYKSYCYWRIAARSNDFSLCSKIEDEKIKSDCNKKILPYLWRL